MKKTSSLVLMATTIVGAVIAKGISPLFTLTQKQPVSDARTECISTAHSVQKEKSAESLSAIVSEKSIPLTFKNDEVYPWTLGEGYIKSGNIGKKNSTSTISFSYQSDKKTEVSFYWLNASTSYHTLKMYVDGVYSGETKSYDLTHVHFFLDKGEHIIEILDNISNLYNSDSQYGLLSNVCVKEILPLESTVLTEKSTPLTFVNESEYPWTIEDGYIQNGNYGYQNSTSKFSTTVKVDKPSKFSFYSSSYYYDNNNMAQSYSGRHYFDFKINGKTYMGREYGEGTTSVLLEPGEYLMEWCDSIYNNTNILKTKVKNIELSSDWIDIELTKAGTLGVEVLYKVNVLNDVELLRVKGNLNSEDWKVINSMNHLISLDLSEAKFNSVPDYAFNGLSRLSYVVLPDGVESIGQYAFCNTQILNIDIPKTVKRIEQYAFNETRLESVNFAENSVLQYIGYQAFRKTNISEFIMPNTVTMLGSYDYNAEQNRDTWDTYTFSECKKLKKVHFSDALKSLENYVCNDCPELQEVHLPKNLSAIKEHAFENSRNLHKIKFPESLKSIGENAFYNSGLDSIVLPLKLTSLATYAFNENDNLKYIELPSYISSYSSNFTNCKSIQKIVCKSATPPKVTYDPFSSGPIKSAVTLVVPSFAVANYKLDSYWYQFGNIQEMDIDLDYWRIANDLSLTNNRRMNGKPDIDLYYGGQLTVDGNAPMTVKNFNIFINENNPGRLLNECASMTADSIKSYFSVNADTWYFLTPLHDVDLTKVTHSNNASFVFRYYDGASRATNGTGSSWRNVDNSKLLAGKGYIFQCNSSGVMAMPSEVKGHIQVLNTNDVTTRLEAHESTTSANKSWNYVGNPYPTYYDVYYMDFTAPITVWTGTTYKAYSIVDDDFVLRPMQSFFVQKPDAVDNIVFHKEGRQMTTGIERVSATKAPAMSSTATPRRFFNLEISNEDELKDETRLVINEDAQTCYEIENDASKFMSINNDVPQIFTIDSEGNNYAINERPQKDGNIGLGYLAAKDGFYTISAVRAEGEIILFDKNQNKYIDLSTQDYTFYTKSTDGVNTNRFVLMVKAKDDNLTGINNTSMSKIRIEGGSGCVNITVNTNANVVVNLINGANVLNKEVTAGNNTLSLPSGIYIIKVDNTSSKVVVY